MRHPVPTGNRGFSPGSRSARHPGRADRNESEARHKAHRVTFSRRKIDPAHITVERKTAGGQGKGTERAREAALVTSGLSIASVGHARPHATWTTALLPLTWKSRDRHPPRKIACSHLDQNRAHLRCGTLSSGTMLHEAPAGWPLHPPTSRQSSSKTIRFPPVNPELRKPDFRVVISVAQSGFQTLWYRCRNVPTKPVHIRS